MAVTQTTKGYPKMSAVNDTLTGSHQIMWIQWVGGSCTGGERLHMTDVDGDTVVDEYASSGYYSQGFPIFNPVTNLKISVIGAGYVIVYRSKRLPIFWNADQ